jgi:transposase
MEHLTDQQAADAVRSRVDWKYLLGLELEDEGFDASVLSEFRTRLVAAGAEELLLDRLLARLVADGLVKAGGRQRTDSTRVVQAVRALNRLELVGETMRCALNALALVAPQWLVAQSDPAWADRYGPRIAASRLPSSEAKREAMAAQIGRDGFTLLAALDVPETPTVLREIEAVQTLRAVWEQQYEQRDDGPRFRPGEALPAGAEQIRTPYDTDARWSIKRETAWTGYKATLTETCDEDHPRLITSVETDPATTHDSLVLTRVQTSLDTRGIVPAEQLVDAAYSNGSTLVESSERGIALIGPVQPDSSWQAKADNGYTAAHFVVDWEAEQATCPAGKTSSSWRPVAGRRDRPAIQIHFRHADCMACAARSRCTTTDRRSITVQQQTAQQALTAARGRQASGDFPARYAMRAGIEGTISQGVRHTGMRTARYRGLAKTHLQHVLTGCAINLIRLAAWFAGDRPTQTRQSAYARLMAQAA